MITHDLGVVAEVTDEIAVMYAGRIVEQAPTRTTIFAAPEHPYTWGLLRSIPRLDRPRDEELVPIPGRPPSLITPPAGCRFHPRCPYVRERTRDDRPDARAGPRTTPTTTSRCLLAAETRAQAVERSCRPAATPPEAAQASDPRVPTGRRIEHRDRGAADERRRR